MKYIIIFTLLVACFACNNQKDNNQFLQIQIDRLQKKVDSAYKPGLGEFMSSIQVHHNKLWFAAQNQNWKLADFEINEIKESLADIKDYCSDRPETNSVGMIDPPIDSITNSIQHKNIAQFNHCYLLLTNTCNNCHHATNHEFNVIKIPDNPPFSNQDFKVQQ